MTLAASNITVRAVTKAVESEAGSFAKAAVSCIVDMRPSGVVASPVSNSNRTGWIRLTARAAGHVRGGKKTPARGRR
ncbi:MAG: hypothetical protein PVI79_13280, partial [Gammaproteobacteria bacterium]